MIFANVLFRENGIASKPLPIGLPLYRLASIGAPLVLRFWP